MTVGMYVWISLVYLCVRKPVCVYVCAHGRVGVWPPAAKKAEVKVKPFF